MLVFVGAITAAVLALQLYAFVESERAYLSPATFSFKGGKLTPNQQLEFRMEVRNSGRSTASMKEFNVTYNIAKKLSDGLHYQEGGTNALAGAVVAGGTMPLRGLATTKEGAPFSLNDDFIKAIDGGETRLSVLGFIRYRDGFSWLWGDRLTGYCFVYKAQADVEFRFEACPETQYTYN